MRGCATSGETGPVVYDELDIPHTKFPSLSFRIVHRSLPPDADHDEVGRQLGYDLFRFGYQVAQADWRAAVREGHAQARARGIAQVRTDRHERKWLQLRASALNRGRVVDPQVTPALLRDIDVAECPVLRIPLTHGELKDSDWSVDRLNNDGAYAPHNLAVISTRANLAKGRRSYEDVYALALHDNTNDGLTALEWMRMASIMLGPCFAPHPRLAPIIPLVAPIPKLTARLATQQIQYACTTNAARPAGKNQVIKRLLPACRDGASRQRMARFVEALHAALKEPAYPWDAWLAPQVMPAFLGWHATMGVQEWAAAGGLAMQLAGARPISATRLHLWKLGNRGYSI